MVTDFVKLIALAWIYNLGRFAADLQVDHWVNRPWAWVEYNTVAVWRRK